MLSVVFAYVLTNDRIVARPQTRRKLQVHHLVVDFIDFYWHNLLQLSYPLLHLYSFRGLIAETLNECFCVGNLFLLVGISPQLLFTTLLAQDDVLIIFHLIVLDVAASYLQGSVGDIIDESPVVAHENNGFLKILKILLQPLY